MQALLAELEGLDAYPLRIPLLRTPHVRNKVIGLIIAVIAILAVSRGLRGTPTVVASPTAEASVAALSAPSPVKSPRRANRPAPRVRPETEIKAEQRGLCEVAVGSFRLMVPTMWTQTSTANPFDVVFASEDGRLGVYARALTDADARAYLRKRAEALAPGLRAQVGQTPVATTNVNGLSCVEQRGTVSSSGGRATPARFWVLRGHGHVLALSAFDEIDRNRSTLKAVIASVRWAEGEPLPSGDTGPPEPEPEPSKAVDAPTASTTQVPGVRVLYDGFYDIPVVLPRFSRP